MTVFLGRLLELVSGYVFVVASHNLVVAELNKVDIGAIIRRLPTMSRVTCMP